MSHHEPAEPTRRDQLLVDRALQGLSPAEAAELDRLLFEQPLDPAELETLDLAAAQLALAYPPVDDEPLPAELAQRIRAEAPQHFDVPTPRLVPAPTRRARPYRDYGAWLGWLAAGLLLGWISTRSITPPTADPPPTIAGPPPAPAPTPDTLWQRLTQRVQPLALAATSHPLAAGASGQVAWDSNRQEGFLRLTGLAPVNSREGVYQLWIWDANRDDRYPVDGGVFTIDNDTTPALIPIRARLPVGQALRFAVTLEPPGGVVVSDRQRVMLVADASPSA